MYPACSNQSVPHTWTKYEGSVQGEVFDAKNHQFRLETKEVNVGFLANQQQQGKEVEFIVKDLTFAKTKTELKVKHWTRVLGCLSEAQKVKTRTC